MLASLCLPPTGIFWRGFGPMPGDAGGVVDRSSAASRRGVLDDAISRLCRSRRSMRRLLASHRFGCQRALALACLCSCYREGAMYQRRCWPNHGLQLAGDALYHMPMNRRAAVGQRPLAFSNPATANSVGSCVRVYAVAAAVSQLWLPDCCCRPKCKCRCTSAPLLANDPWPPTSW